MQPQLLKLERPFQSSVLTKIDDPRLESHQIELWIKRDDNLYPIISGNK
jgi:1-aminocyclopropane-1-carboxylate deaminase